MNTPLFYSTVFTHCNFFLYSTYPVLYTPSNFFLYSTYAALCTPCNVFLYPKMFSTVEKMLDE